MDTDPLPDPCTIVLRVPEKTDHNEAALMHWLWHAHQQGYSAVWPSPRRCGDPRTWCGDITVDGVAYQVLRGPRLREPCRGSPLGYVFCDSVWVEPLLSMDIPPPEPRFDQLTVDVAEVIDSYDEQEIEVVLRGRADGRHTAVTLHLSLDPGMPLEDEDEEDYYEGPMTDPGAEYDEIEISVLPGADFTSGGINVCALDGTVLTLRFFPENCHSLGLPERVRFTLDVAPRKIEEVRNALARMIRELPERNRPAVVRL